MPLYFGSMHAYCDWDEVFLVKAIKYVSKIQVCLSYELTCIASGIKV